MAVVGYGLAGEVFHAPLIDAVPDLSLVSIVTANPERAARARERYPGANVLADVEAVWNAAGAHDLVVVATPNRSHVPVALGAIEAGRHVVVDKPFTPTSAEGHRVAAAAKERGVLLSVFQNRRLDGDFLTLRGLVARGELGRVLRFESRFERWRPALRPGAWRERGAPQEAGGVLFDLGSHLVDQAIQLFGRPTRVYAEVERRREGAEVDDDVFIALVHSGGVVSHLWASLVAPSSGPRFRVLGMGGAFEKHGLDVQEDQLKGGRRPEDPGYGEEPAEAWGVLTEPDGERRRIPTERGAYNRFYEGVAEAVRGVGDPPVSPEDAVTTIEVLEAAREAGRTGRPAAFG